MCFWTDALRCLSYLDAAVFLNLPLISGHVICNKLELHVPQCHKFQPADWQVCIACELVVKRSKFFAHVTFYSDI